MLRLGLALSLDRAVIVPLGRKGVAVAHAELPGPLADSLPAALDRLKGEMEGALGRSTTGAVVRAVLLPPLSDARVIPLPPLSREDTRAVLERDVGRHFLGGSEPQMVGFRRPSGRRASEGEPVPVFVAAALRSTLETVRSAAVAAGWKLESIEAAHGVWQAAASGDADAVLAVKGDTVHLIRFDRGVPQGVRRLPAHQPGAAAEALGSDPGRIALLAEADKRTELSAGLESRGWRTYPLGPTWPDAESATAAMAGTGTLELVPATLAAERVLRSRRLAARLVAAALVLLLAAAAAVLWGTERELAAVQGQREAIRAQVAPLLATRDSLSRLEDRIRTLDELRVQTVRWVPALVEISLLLPMDTHLTALFASGDTLEMEAAGEQAGEAIQALREAGILEDVRLDGIVERELEDGETVTERFRVRGRLAGFAGAGGGS